MSGSNEISYANFRVRNDLVTTTSLALLKARLENGSSLTREISKISTSINVRPAADCPWCKGTGFFRAGLQCGPCGGSGLMQAASANGRSGDE